MNGPLCEILLLRLCCSLSTVREADSEAEEAALERPKEPSSQQFLGSSVIFLGIKLALPWGSKYTNNTHFGA